MKKGLLLIVAILTLVMFAFTACAWNPISDKDCKKHVDVNYDQICDKCQEDLSPEKPDDGPTVCQHVDANNNHVCDSCSQVISEHADEDSNHVCDVCGTTTSACLDEDGDAACDICGEEFIPSNMERVSYSFNISGQTAGTLDRDIINGKFTILAGSKLRNRTRTYEGVEYTQSVQVADANTKIKVDVPGSGTLSFLIQNGSSSATTQFIKVTGPDGTVYDIEFAGTNEGSPVVKIELEVTQGEWIISRGKNGGTQDIYYLSLDCIVEKANENGFEIVSEGIVDYICGQELDLSSLVLVGTYSNGKTEPIALADVTLDASAVNMGVSGVYPVGIQYKEYPVQTFSVNVYQPESITLGYDSTIQKGQSSAGNGLYVNQSFKEVYSVGEALDLTGLSAIVVAKLNGAELEFNLNGNYEVGSVDLTTAGTKQVAISYSFGGEKVTAYATIHVVDTAPSIVDETYQVKVDASYTGTIGAVSEGYNMFTTVQQALDFLAKAEQGKQKVMVIEEGLYTEKIEITIPNLHIKGAGKDKVTIEWNSIYGVEDAGGFSQVTDSTQTVAVRDTAVNVTIEGVTISNYWNSQERMDEAGLAIERGLALLVMADQFIMKDSALLGIQDTLELFTGRQYFENVFISGYTDFIFGTNNTTIFKGCTIHVIDTSKDDSGTAGYITAFKGLNKGSQDAIVYGAIFYQCNFTADAGVMEGKTAIGRTWGASAAVAVINSELGAHISVAGYNPSNNKNTRYISMNGIHPTDSTVQFVEYGNTGAGAITEAVAGMTMLTAEQAAKYVDFAVVYGKTNGGVSWLDAWDPTSTEVQVDDRTYYYFDQSTGMSGTAYTFDTTTSIARGETLTWEGLLISAENGNVAWNQNANALNMKQGAYIKFTVAAGTEVTIKTYPKYNHFALNGVSSSSSDTLVQYYAQETEVILLSTGDAYLYSIILNPGEAAPATPTLTEIKVAGMNVNYIVGDTVSVEGASVTAHYSDGTYKVITGYEVDESAVNMSVAGEYQITFSFEGKTASVKITVEAPNVGPEIAKDTVLDFTSEAGYNEVVANAKVTTTGNFRNNGSEYQVQGTVSFQVKAGTMVTVIPYGTSSYVAYTLGKEGEANLETRNSEYTVIFEEDCTVVYTGLSNNYLKSIEIRVPIAESMTVDFGSAGNYKDCGIDFSGANVRDNGGNNSQISSGSFSFMLKAGSTLTINGYPGYTSYKLSDGTVTTDEITEIAYTYTASASALITITPVSGNNYFYSLVITCPQPAVKENITVTFGSEGNYKESGIDFSGIQIGDNGGNNSQVKNGSFKVTVLEGGVLTINGYPGYTSYKLSDGTTTTEEITAAEYVYTATADVEVTITPVSGNNYFYSFSITYSTASEPVVNTYVLETSTLEKFDKGAKANGDTTVEGAFTIHWSSNSKVDGTAKTWADEYTSAGPRINFGGQTAIGSTTKNAIEFTVEGTAVVKVWYVSNTDNSDRPIAIFDASGAVVATHAVTELKNATGYCEFTISASGTYYLGYSASANYFFKVEVVDTVQG